MSVIVVHNEYWSAATGGEIIGRATAAVLGLIDRESIHIYTPWMLPIIGVAAGEASVYWSARLADDETFADAVQAIRAAGIRVKDACLMGDEWGTASYSAMAAERDRLVDDEIAEHRRSLA